MGWLFTRGTTKADIIEDLTRETPSIRTIRHSVRGNTMYAVIEAKATGQRTIMVYLLAGRRDYGWGYKDIDESMGPVECDCPLWAFELVPEPPNDWARTWRERVRARHAARNDRKRRARFLAKQIEPGAPVVVAGGIRLGGSRVDGQITLAYFRGENAVVRTNRGLVRVRADRITAGA